MAKLFFDKCLNLVNPNMILNNFGQTALHILPFKYTSVNAINVAKKLIEDGADINKLDNANFTPLMVACSKANIKFIEYYISVGGKSAEYFDDLFTDVAIQIYISYISEKKLFDEKYIDCLILLIRSNVCNFKSEDKPFDVALMVMSSLICSIIPIDLLNRIFLELKDHIDIKKYSLLSLFNIVKFDKCEIVSLLIEYIGDGFLTNTEENEKLIKNAVYHNSVASVYELVSFGINLTFPIEFPSTCEYDGFDSEFVVRKTTTLRLQLGSTHNLFNEYYDFVLEPSGLSNIAKLIF